MKTRRPPAPKSDEQVITKETPEVADRRQLILSAVEPLRMKTRLAGLFLFLPLLAKLRFDFFHMDCLSSEVRLNVDLDVTLTVIANGCYRWLASRLKGFEKAKPKQLWRKFVETGGMIEVLPNRHLRITFDRRSHNPILREAALDQDCPTIAWLKRYRIEFDYTSCSASPPPGELAKMSVGFHPAEIGDLMERTGAEKDSRPLPADDWSTNTSTQHK